MSTPLIRGIRQLMDTSGLFGVESTSWSSSAHSAIFLFSPANGVSLPHFATVVYDLCCSEAALDTYGRISVVRKLMFTLISYEMQDVTQQMRLQDTSGQRSREFQILLVSSKLLTPDDLRLIPQCPL